MSVPFGLPLSHEHVRGAHGPRAILFPRFHIRLPERITSETPTRRHGRPDSSWIGECRIWPTKSVLSASLRANASLSARHYEIPHLPRPDRAVRESTSKYVGHRRCVEVYLQADEEAQRRALALDRDAA